jgi:hypothetical protein
VVAMAAMVGKTNPSIVSCSKIMARKCEPA